jgi:sulfonate transport system substrate-binding protein
VPAASPIRRLADLRGKRVALNKGSNVHFLLVQALASAGLKPNDITSVYLAPADARAAFEEGSVDAWVIWDPFLAAGQAATGARVLADAQGLAPNRQFFLASRELVTRHEDIVHALMGQISQADHWAQTHQDEVATLLAPKLGVPAPILRIALARMGYGAGPMTAEAIADQQRIADTFHALKLIPVPVDVRSALWTPKA